MSGGRPGGIGTRGGPRPRCVCPACGREVGTTEAGKVVYHNRPGRTFPECEGVGAVTAVPPRPAAPACPVGRVVYGNRPCDGPGSYYCDSDLWGSACRRYYEQKPAPPAPDATAVDGLREALRHHHPIMRSETGPFSGCRCGAVKLGQDVIEHVVTELRRALDGTT